MAMAIMVAVTRLNLPYGRVHDPDRGWTMTRRSGREDLLLLRVELSLGQRAGVEEFLELHQVPVRVRRRAGRFGDGRSGLLGYCGFLVRRSYCLLVGCLLLRLGRAPLGGHVCRGSQHCGTSQHPRHGSSSSHLPGTRSRSRRALSARTPPFLSATSTPSPRADDQWTLTLPREVRQLLPALLGAGRRE